MLSVLDMMESLPGCFRADSCEGYHITGFIYWNGLYINKSNIVLCLFICYFLFLFLQGMYGSKSGSFSSLYSSNDAADL